MEVLLLFFDKSSDHKSGRADSFSDKLNSKYTVYLLSIFAVISTTRLYIDEPISCFCPTEWTNSEIAFAEKMCWTQNTFYVPLKQVSLREKHSEVSYYQWMSLIFAFQAFLFFLPSSLWKILSKKSGLALTSITDACSHSRKCADLEDTTAAIDFASHNLNSFLRSLDSRSCSSALRCFFRGRSLSIVYLVVKCAYLANAIGQLYYLDAFLGNDFHYYGLRVVNRMMNGQTWSSPHSFPRVTYCNVMERVVGNNNQHTIQCTLPMNLYYQMLLLLLWFWLVIVMTVTSFSLLKWIVVLFVPCIRHNHISNYNFCAQLTNDTNSLEKISKFVDYMKTDGFFIIKMVEIEAGEWIGAQVMKNVWQKFMVKNEGMFRSNIASSPLDEGFESCKTSEKGSFENI